MTSSRRADAAAFSFLAAALAAGVRADMLLSPGCGIFNNVGLRILLFPVLHVGASVLMVGVAVLCEV